MRAAPIYVPKLLSHQLPWAQSAARFKWLRMSRRAGKTIFDMVAAIQGHGPMGPDGPRFPGIASGRGDVVWVLPTYKQRVPLWEQEIVPRFEAHPYCRVNKADLFLELPNRGRLYVWSADAGAIQQARGLGKRLIGLIFDEGAHLDLQTALESVLRWTLVDNKAWVIISSTTNSGPDGFMNAAGEKRTPSYFNLQCARCMAGELGPEHEHFYATGFMNPVLDPVEVQKAIDDIADPRLRDEEGYAKLLLAGAGVAFPEFAEDAHVVAWAPELEPPHTYRWSAGGDWGYTKHGWLGLFATSKEGRTVCRHEYYFRQTDPYTVGYEWARQLLRYPRIEYQIMDAPGSMDGGPDILHKVARGFQDALGPGRRPPPFLRPTKSGGGAHQGHGYRQTAKIMLHEMLKYRRASDGSIPAHGAPLLTFHRTGCPNLIRIVQAIQIDPKNPADVDTKAEDHPYDGLKDWCMMSPTGALAGELQRKLAQAHEKHPDDHPGFGRRPEPAFAFGNGHGHGEPAPQFDVRPPLLDGNGRGSRFGGW